jgi:hypothetical protein
LRRTSRKKKSGDSEQKIENKIRKKTRSDIYKSNAIPCGTSAMD